VRSDSVSSHEEELAARAGSGAGSQTSADAAPQRTGSDVDAQAATGPRTVAGGDRPRFLAWAERLISSVIRNPLFCAALVLAAVLRAVVMAGFRPAVLIRLDSYIYLVDATRWTPDPDNTNGYPFFLWLIRPFHSLALIVGLQHLMGLSVAVLMYAILRRYRVPRWAATLATLPTLFDPRQLLIEHSVMADTVAMLLMIAAFAVLLVPRTPSVWWSGTAGLLLGLSCLVRPTALPLLVLVALFLLLSRAGWRKAVAALIAGALPVASYAAWFSLSYGVFNLTNSSGMFLWARTMTFANCAVIKPPPDLLPLCPDRNPALPGKLRPDPYSWHTLLQQENPQDFLWSRRDWPWQPRPSGYEPYQVAFTPAKNARAQRFALRAIAAQPLGYATVVAEGIALTFLKTDHVWQFRGSRPAPSVLYGTARYELNAVQAYTGGTAGVAPYLGHRIVTRSQSPYSAFVSRYQRLIYLPGVLFAALFAVGLAGIVIRRRRAGPALLLWSSAVIVFVLPIAENQFNYRYALAAVPLTVLAAALSTAQRADVPPAHGRALAPGRPEEPPAETDRDPALPRTGRVTELGGAG
jgi:hypothetical protein